MTLSYELRGSYLLARVDGPFDPRAARAGMGDVLRECQARGVDRLLIDGRGITSTVSIADRYDLATMLASNSDGRVRIAIVVSAENMFTKTLEDTAANRGLRVRTTDSMEDARAFLELSPQS